MIIDQGTRAKARRIGRRHGTALTVLFLLIFPVLLAVLFFAVNAAFLAEAKATLHNSADAAALAAVQSLVDDSWLTGSPADQLHLIELARNQAQAYAATNKVLGQPVALEVPAKPADNHANGDVIFAFLDQPRNPDPKERVLVVADLDGTYNGSSFLPLVNSVRVNARRFKARGTALDLWGGKFTGVGSFDAVTKATATLDRDVVGFQPMGGQPLPLAPIALLTRATPGIPVSWDNELLQGQDNWKLDPATGAFHVGSDNLPEATIVINADETQASAALLLLGISDLVGPSGQNTFAGQLASGVSANDLETLGGVFALRQSDNRLDVAATPGDTSIYSLLASQLNQIQGQKRIWPLYESFDATTGHAVVAGFVAARVVQASATASGVTIVLQPCMLATRTALTDSAQRGVGGVNITNRYICKVRLVE